jgi:hypothetical protein
MKTKNIIQASILTVILMLTAQFASAAIYYVCIGSTLSFSTPTPITDVTYSWDVKDTDGTTSLSGYPRASAPTSLPSTAGTYLIRLISTPDNATVCAPDVVENSFVVLPALSVTIGAPSLAAYCETAATKTSLITQTTSSVPGGTTSDLEIEYSYMVAKDGGAAVDGTTGSLGSIDGTGKYTLSTVVPGSYVITGYVKYKQKTGFTNKLLSAGGCPANSGTQTVTVTAKPTAPTITVTSN